MIDRILDWALHRVRLWRRKRQHERMMRRSPSYRTGYTIGEGLDKGLKETIDRIDGFFRV